MSLINSLLGIGTVYAAPSIAALQSSHLKGFWSMLWLPFLLILIFYFLLIRPQTKRVKEHKQLLERISLRDEVITTGGILGKVTQLKDDFVVLEIAKSTAITIQKGSIASVLPKNTIDSL
ncbi:preprotein translocase subunit YajC [Coxiella endosymbiont of Amblyomma americanum]|uniref:preprotein translocase subunit YajC n=1 Tax=Coxiella endosymbiont of Amblyomma americanum TaxID=325775 RepID=UPI00057D71EA|nr:preprotein translocase subunit YajC [Coxiella endosymbiont of Amblyomma americanum]AJC50600.1 preprotein translocase subunit YajC [Coxiella endosymbiont of Amblyomma americanum]AUJ58930.1 preprotein translocase subunit YajC [Coxiella-like endosymbiont of Amblyomma americanum]